MRTALVIVDMLHDFIKPDGKLYFENGQTVVAPIVRLKRAFRAAGIPVLYSNDTHPEDSAEFASWPPHCLVGSPGARIIPELPAEPGDIILCKDSLSLFQGGEAGPILRGLGVERLCMAGVATEYCVKSCALDALKQGLEVVVVKDAIAGVDLRAGDARQALEAMALAGVRFATAASLPGDLADRQRK